MSVMYSSTALAPSRTLVGSTSSANLGFYSSLRRMQKLQTDKENMRQRAPEGDEPELIDLAKDETASRQDSMQCLR